MAAADNGSLATTNGLEHANRSPAGDAAGPGKPHQRHDRLVQRPADVLEDEGHQPVCGARDRRSGPDRRSRATSTRSTQNFVNEVFWTNPSGTVDDLVSSQSVWVNKRLATLFPGLELSERSADQQHQLRESHLAGVARAGRHVDAARVPVGGVRSGGHVDRPARQVHPRRRPLSGRSPDEDRPVDAGGDERHQLQVTGRHDDVVRRATARCSSPTRGWRTSPARPATRRWTPTPASSSNFGPIGNYRTKDEGGRPDRPDRDVRAESPLAPEARPRARRRSRRRSRKAACCAGARSRRSPATRSAT